MVRIDRLTIYLKQDCPERNGKILTKDDRAREHPVVVCWLTEALARKRPPQAQCGLPVCETGAKK